MLVKLTPIVIFHKHFWANFLLPKIPKPNCEHIKAAQKHFRTKNCSSNVGKIGTWWDTHCLTKSVWRRSATVGHVSCGSRRGLDNLVMIATVRWPDILSHWSHLKFSSEFINFDTSAVFVKILLYFDITW